MPKEAIRLQAVDTVLPLNKIAQAAMSRIAKNVG
jgi:chemotaxis response regulator CheB